MTSGGLLVFFGNELITFRNKNYRFNLNVIMFNKKSFGGCEKDIGSSQNGIFKHLFFPPSIYILYV